MEKNSTEQQRVSWPNFLDVLTDSGKTRRVVVEKATETERMAVFLLRRAGWTAQIVKAKKKHFEIEIQKAGESAAVRVTNQRSKVRLNQIEKFICFLNRQKARGYFISTSGFTPSVHTFLREEKIENLRPVIMRGNQLIWEAEDFEGPAEKRETVYVGVFTCKGGVGKTTVSAHLAGAFALNGYDVALVDLDHQQNLRKLLGPEVDLPETNAKISVLSGGDWNERKLPGAKIVICDCNPEFDANPIEFIRRFDHCIVPTTLNPLGVNKNADVIKRTFEAIRRENERANLFVLINNLHSDEEHRNIILDQILRSEFEKFTEGDRRSHYINPEDAAIRFSKQLLYWGFHIFNQGEPKLAFRSVGGYCYPRTDFLKLADYLELHTEIQKTKTLSARAGRF
ncbi:MAG: ParA family protein [Pyrinomonadaceae bacterium]